MNCLTFLKSLKISFFKSREKKQPKISLLIPFSSNDRIRQENFKWLLQYWRSELPDAEIIIGKSKSKIFCKGEALNDAVSRSQGQILIVLDADAYLSGAVIEQCANNILEQEKLGYALWYVPYRNLYRLTRAATSKIVDSHPKFPYRLPIPMDKNLVENQGDSSRYGHRFGAMITIFSRKAYNILGCFDERFKGWGGEDIALLRALDTLYGKHKTTNTAVYHLWHPFLGETHQQRVWEKQTGPNPNGMLASRYNKANRNYKNMRKLVDEAYQYFLQKV